MGHFLDMSELTFSGILVHELLLREVHTSNLEDEMWFYIGRKRIRFSRQEFVLITGLQMRDYPPAQQLHRKLGTRLWDTYFSGVKKLSYIFLDQWYARLNLEKMDDADAVKLSLFYFVHRVLIPRDERSGIQNFVLCLVDDLDEFNKYPWGNIAWTVLHNSLKKAAFQKLEKIKRKGFAQKKFESYNVYGFSHAFLVRHNFLVLNFLILIIYFVCIRQTYILNIIILGMDFRGNSSVRRDFWLS